ncbi:MAG: cell division ATP-binding protein FtsE [Bacillota bacterium]|nr:cell division ATP-binding protein FtsE [Bacillota bacterium]
MIEFYGVSKTFPNQVTALRDIDLQVGNGEFVFVVGPSGAGKSTLVKLVYREEIPTRGRLLVGGRDVTALRPAQVCYLRRTIGVVFQDFRLLPNKTVFDNVAFAMRVVEAGPREIRRRVPQVLELVGLSDRARACPDELSGGEQQRVGLARAIVNNPSVLLADEPTGNLDPRTSLEILRLLMDINRMGTTVIMATHARHLVNVARRRVVELDAGRLVRDELRGGYGHEG